MDPRRAALIRRGPRPDPATRPRGTGGSPGPAAPPAPDRGNPIGPGDVQRSVPAPLADTPTPDAERALLVAAATDPAAQAALVERYGPLVWALCRRLAPSPEDAWQSAWAHLLPRLPRYDPALAAPSTWITTVVHRLLVDEHRRRGRQGAVVPLEPRAAPAPDEHLDAARRLRRLEEALQRLPEDQRRVVVLHHVHGLDLAAIAEAEDLPPGTVKSRLHRARARLAALMGASS